MAKAAARPMPALAPVTIATFPFKSFTSILLTSGHPAFGLAMSVTAKVRSVLEAFDTSDPGRQPATLVAINLWRLFVERDRIGSNSE
jgi:hypothetical protein